MITFPHFYFVNNRMTLKMWHTVQTQILQTQILHVILNISWRLFTFESDAIICEMFSSNSDHCMTESESFELVWADLGNFQWELSSYWATIMRFLMPSWVIDRPSFRFDSFHTKTKSQWEYKCLELHENWIPNTMYRWIKTRNQDEKTKGQNDRREKTSNVRIVGICLVDAA